MTKALWKVEDAIEMLQLPAAGYVALIYSLQSGWVSNPNPNQNHTPQTDWPSECAAC